MTEASFPRLPPEIRDMILKLLVLPARRLKWGNQLLHSAYATVCKQWQLFFERINFKHIHLLTRYDVFCFGDKVHGRRRWYVEWIWLDVQLPRYDCSRCKTRESDEEIRRHNRMFTNMFWDLTDILAYWERTEPFINKMKGLTLELSAHSVDDQCHYYKELGARMDDTAWGGVGGWYGLLRKSRDNAHMWREQPASAPRVPFPNDETNLRVFGPPKGLKFDLLAPAVRKMEEKLPRAKIVKGLVIRRQFYRGFSVSHTLLPIMRVFTRIESFVFEPWRSLETEHIQPHGQPILAQAIREADYDILFNDLIKYAGNLKRLTIFENHDSRLHRTTHKLLEHPPSPPGGHGFLLACSSLYLEELYASLNVDACQFFSPFWPGAVLKNAAILAADLCKWHSLKRLSLSSQSAITTPGDGLPYDDLIRAAGAAAIKMPLLEIMELWGCDDHTAGVFQYRRSVRRAAATTATPLDSGPRTEQARIRLLTTWGAWFSDDAIAAWKKAANSHGKELEAVEARTLKPKFFREPSDILGLLDLGDCLMTRTSAQQIMCESLGVLLPPARGGLGCFGSSYEWALERVGGGGGDGDGGRDGGEEGNYVLLS